MDPNTVCSLVWHLLPSLNKTHWARTHNKVWLGKENNINTLKQKITKPEKIKIIIIKNVCVKWSRSNYLRPTEISRDGRATKIQIE